MKIDIQLFGGRGSSSSASGRAKRELEKYSLQVENQRFFAGDEFDLKTDGPYGKASATYIVTEVKKDSIEVKIQSINAYGAKEGQVGKMVTWNKEELQDRLQYMQNYKEGNINRSLNAKLRNAKRRENITKDAQTQINKFKKDGVKVLSKVPKGYSKLEGATTAPRGYTWYSNGKSRFSGEYKHVLVKNK